MLLFNRALYAVYFPQISIGSITIKLYNRALYAVYFPQISIIKILAEFKAQVYPCGIGGPPFVLHIPNIFPNQNLVIH